ncbi:unnamed protein product [Adineta steineri]|nr:unnamed protein product [Adineta steineri]
MAHEKLHLEEYLIRGNGHQDLNETLYSDCLEAILGAIALDCGSNQQEKLFQIETYLHQQAEQYLKQADLCKDRAQLFKQEPCG